MAHHLGRGLDEEAQRAVSLPLSLILATGCARSEPTPSPQSAPVAPVSDPLTQWLSLRDLTQAALLARLGADDSVIQHGLSYGPSTDLDLVYVPDVSPARVYLRSGKVVLVQLSGADLSALDPDALAARFPPQEGLASRAGKAFEHQLAASQGVAWSDDTRRVAILELFPPTSVEDYKARFYAAPGAFIK